MAKRTRVSTELICRGDGKLYARVSVRAFAAFQKLGCAVQAEGFPVPGHAYPLSNCEQGADQRWVLVLPLLDRPLHIELWPDDRRAEAVTVVINPAAAKWASRLNYRLRSASSQAIRDFEQPFVDGRYQVHLADRFEADDGAVWRFYVEWAGDAERRPTISFRGVDGEPLDVQPRFFELQPADGSREGARHRLYLSATVPLGSAPFIIEASDGGERDGASSGDQPFEPGFVAVSASVDAKMEADMRERMKSAADDDAAYRRWLKRHQASQADLKLQREAPASDALLFSVALVGDIANAAASKTLASIHEQSYVMWELLVPASVAQRLQAHEKRLLEPAVQVRVVPDGALSCRARMLAEAAGDYVACVECGDVLEPDALFQLAHVAQEHNLPDVLYCDSDTLGSDGYCKPVFRTQLDLDLLYNCNYIGEFYAVKREMLDRIAAEGGGASAADAYDTLLRACECGGRFAHIPRMLLHRGLTTGDEAFADVGEAERSALQGHLDRRRIAANVEACDMPSGLRVRYDLPAQHPLVSIVIPSKDHIEVLDACVRSIEEKSAYDAYEIIVVENNSDDRATFEYYERLQREFANVRVVTWPDEFNYSKIVNFGAKHAKGEYLLFLNNDTEVVSPDFIEGMLGLAQRPEVGVVGAKLLFRDGLVQHAGMAVGPYDAIVHVNQNFPATRGGYLDRTTRPGSFTAVTGACQMVRANVFADIGGYDEELAVGFNDADFCLRAWEAGLRVVMAQDVLLHHYEFTSRGRESADDAKRERWKREQAYFKAKWPKPFEAGDPFTNPNLARDSLYYRL